MIDLILPVLAINKDFCPHPLKGSLNYLNKNIIYLDMPLRERRHFIFGGKGKGCVLKSEIWIWYFLVQGVEPWLDCFGDAPLKGRITIGQKKKHRNCEIRHGNSIQP